ncbi:MAG TPA: secretin N-terminal domain-containing protein [Steroidobacteraceae bacterium]|nr:secretin N-terminal domain-containing protein [Steroidobacteraceae bacterium]
MKAVLIASALALASLPPAAPAADEAGDSTVTATPGIDLRALIAVSQKTHRTFLVDPRVAGSVHLDGAASHEVTYPLLLTILAVHGFAAYEQQGVVVVTPDANERFFPSSLVRPDDIRGPDAEIVTTIVPLKTARAPELATILRPLMAPNASLNAMADRNVLVVVDRAANVRRIVALIHELEKVPLSKPE